MRLVTNYRLVDDKSEVDIRKELADVEITYGLPRDFYTVVEVAEGVVKMNRLKRRLKEYERYDKMQSMWEPVRTVGQE
jgi:hypothetical protein